MWHRCSQQEDLSLLNWEIDYLEEDLYYEIGIDISKVDDYFSLRNK
jgi:hypothetical protein